MRGYQEFVKLCPKKVAAAICEAHMTKVPDFFRSHPPVVVNLLNNSVFFFQLLDNPPLLLSACTPNALGLSLVKSESLLATFPHGFEVLLFPNHVD